MVVGRARRGGERFVRSKALRVRIAIDDDLADVGEQLRGPVAALGQLVVDMPTGYFGAVEQTTLVGTVYAAAMLVGMLGCGFGVLLGSRLTRCMRPATGADRPSVLRLRFENALTVGHMSNHFYREAHTTLHLGGLFYL